MLVEVNVLVNVIALLGVIKSCTCSYTRTLRFLIPRSCAYLGSVNLSSGLNCRAICWAKLGFKSKCRAGFGLQTEAHLQLWLLHLCAYILHSPCNAVLFACLHGCAIACSLKQTFALCKIFLQGTLVANAAIATGSTLWGSRSLLC